jgi:hypothetical protein
MSSPLFRCSNIERFALGRDLEVLVEPLGPARIVTRELADRLASCTEFRTTTEHAERIGRSLALGDAEVRRLEADLLELAEAGFMIGREDLLADCKRTASREDAPPRIAALGIPTCNRPGLLVRALRSYVGNFQRHDRRDVELVVTDDSPDAEASTRTRSALGRMASELGVRISYAGVHEKEDFALSLCRTAGLYE